MASLRELLEEKNLVEISETNLDTGQVFSFTPGDTHTSQTPNHFLMCWEAPGAGTAVIEVWGASGSAGANCCCSLGLPGNPGAYSKKTMTVTGSSFVCGKIGGSCWNTTCCYKGRSECSCICFSGSTEQGTMIAQGGRGGPSFNQNSGTAIRCCYTANGYPFTEFSNYCGIVCNYVDGEIATASGGDTNCNGGWSCMIFYHCNSCCTCRHTPSIKTSPGIYSRDGAVITYSMEQDTHRQNGSGVGQMHMYSALGAASRTPGSVGPMAYCWQGGRMCSCYGQSACFMTLPFGIPAAPQMACSNQWDYGMRGGHGAVRITFSE